MSKSPNLEFAHHSFQTSFENPCPIREIIYWDLLKSSKAVNDYPQDQFGDGKNVRPLAFFSGPDRSSRPLRFVSFILIFILICLWFQYVSISIFIFNIYPFHMASPPRISFSPQALARVNVNGHAYDHILQLALGTEKVLGNCSFEQKENKKQKKKAPKIRSKNIYDYTTF